jgi:regulator of replication initiation timing
MVRRTLPLHKQLKSMYQQNLALKRENKTLKQNLQQLETDKKGKGKLDLLAEATKI